MNLKIPFTPSMSPQLYSPSGAGQAAALALKSINPNCWLNGHNLVFYINDYGVNLYDVTWGKSVWNVTGASFGSDRNADNYLGTGITGVNLEDGWTNMPSNAYEWGQLVVIGSAIQIYAEHSGDKRLWVRVRYGSWSAWRYFTPAGVQS